MAQVTKGEAEKVIRHLCSRWSKLKNIPMAPKSVPSFYEFYLWVESNYPQYLRFRSGTSVQDDVERWFIEEFKQRWRY